ncbi:MAG: archease [Phycisphaerales bacterium]|nr:MAG: archease [Phycisphaerales bacterium]
MKGSYELFEHTADIGIRAIAPTLQGLVEAAGEGLYAVIGELLPAGDPRESLIEAEADSPAVLLRDYLGELLLTFERDGRIVTSVSALELGDEKLKASVQTERLDKARSRLHHEIKAVTYHELDLRETEEGFEATIIVDI